MISIHEKTAKTFDTLGLGTLSPSLCTVREELNGLYELEMEHPYDPEGKWKRLEKERILFASTPRGNQPFRIYQVSPDMKGIKVNARHVFYDLLDGICLSVSAQNTTAQQALNAIKGAIAYAMPHVFLSELTGTGSIVLKNTNPVGAILGMDEDRDSLVKSYGGEILRDGFTVTVKPSVGQDRGVQIRYAKNLIGLEITEDISETVTRIYPIGKDGLTLSGGYVSSDRVGDYLYPKVAVLEDNELTTQAQLRQAALDAFAAGADLPKVNIKAGLQLLSKTEEYKNFAVLEEVQLGDVVTVTHNRMGFQKKAKVISYEWDSLLEQYKEVELGDFVADLTSSITSGEKSLSTAVTASTEVKQVYGLISGKVTINAQGLYICVDGTGIDTAQKVVPLRQ